MYERCLADAPGTSNQYGARLLSQDVADETVNLCDPSNEMPALRTVRIWQRIPITY